MIPIPTTAATHHSHNLNLHLEDLTIKNFLLVYSGNVGASNTKTTVIRHSQSTKYQIDLPFPLMAKMPLHMKSPPQTNPKIESSEKLPKLFVCSENDCNPSHKIVTIKGTKKSNQWNNSLYLNRFITEYTKMPAKPVTITSIAGIANSKTKQQTSSIDTSITLTTSNKLSGFRIECLS
jgi:hypothetical protein